MSVHIISEWFQKYKHDVYHFLVYYTGKQDVEDLVQEVFINCMKSPRLAEISNPKAWLITVARHVAINAIRKQKLISWLPDTILEHLPASSKTPEEEVQLNGEVYEIYKAINQLKKSYREVILLREIQELTVQETASVLGWTPNKVNITLHRALKKLRETLLLQEGSEWIGSRYESR